MEHVSIKLFLYFNFKRVERSLKQRLNFSSSYNSYFHNCFLWSGMSSSLFPYRVSHKQHHIKLLISPLEYKSTNFTSKSVIYQNLYQMVHQHIHFIAKLSNNTGHYKASPQIDICSANNWIQILKPLKKMRKISHFVENQQVDYLSSKVEVSPLWWFWTITLSGLTGL